MTIKLQKSLTDFSSACEIIETDSVRACSFAMDDGGRCLLDVISDPLLLQSFLESGSDDNSKDPQDGTSSESAVESPQVTRYPQVSLSNHVTSLENVIEPPDQMGYSYPGDGQGLLAHSAGCSIGMSLSSGTALIVGSSSSATLTYQHASSSRTTIQLPTSTAQSSIHQHSPVPPRPHTPVSHSSRSPGQGSPSVHMPPPSPLQQTRSPLTSHTPSPAPAWSPVPPVLSPATSRVQSSMPSIAFQQPHNQVLQATANVTQIVTAFSQQNQKLSMQQQQQPPLLLHPQTSPIPSPQHPARISMTSPVVTTASVPVTPSMVQIIPAPQANVPLPVRTTHSTVRPIQPKLPQQILPKPASTAANQFVSPVVKPTNSTPVTASQRGVSVPLQTAATSQLVIGQGQPGMFSGPQGTIVLNSIIPGMGQSPILIQGNLGNLANLQGLQLTLRPPVSANSSQPLTSGAQSNPTLIAALQSPNQPAQALFTQTKSPLQGQQTIVIPNNIAPTGLTPQNLNLTPTAIRNSTIVPSASQGQGFLARSNIILSSRVVGPNQGLQLQQIQTPQGPILALASSGTIALPHLPAALQNATLGNQLTSGAVPLQSVMAAGQSVISGLPLQSQHATLHQHSQNQAQPLFSATVPLTGQMEQSSQPVVHLPQTVSAQHIAANLPTSRSPALQLQAQSQQDNPSPKPLSPPKPSKVPSVNLEELLKEHGIVPENTPPPSPDSQSPPSEDPVPAQLQVHSPIVQSPQLIAALQSQHHVVLEHPNQNPLPTSPLTQVKLALAQDGSVIIQPHAFIPARFSHSPGQTKITSTVSSSVLPTVTSVSAPVTTQPCASRNHSALLARLNSAPAISIPEVSLGLVSSSGSCTSATTSSTITTTAPMLIPLTVQSLNMSSASNTTSHVQPVTTVSSVLTGQIPIELCSSLPQSVNHTTTSSVPTVFTQQNVQSRLNHVIFGFQPIIASSHQHPASSVQTVTKSLAGFVSGNPSLSSSRNSVSSADNSHVSDNIDTIAPSHKLQSITPVVPNDVLKIQKEINEIISLKFRTPEQQRVLTQLLAFQQNFDVQTKLACGQVCRVNVLKQQVCHSEADSESQTPSASTTGCTHKCKQVSINVAEQEYIQSEKQVSMATFHAITPAVVTSVSHCDVTRSTTVSESITQKKVEQENIGPSLQRHNNVSLPLPSLATENNQGKPVIRISSASKTTLFSKQLALDQNYALSPDTKTPFSSKQDAIQRLLKYHVYNSKVPSYEEMATADQMFEKVSVQLLDKFRKMMNKYHLLQLKESLRPCPTPERVLLERLFQEDEKATLERDKASAAEGKSLNLPPLPSHWLKELSTPSSTKPDRDENASPTKDDSDHLEAPVIDSCIDATSPTSDLGDRSPPTLKRIVVKTECSPDTEFEELCSKKRLKIQNTILKSEANTAWCTSNLKIETKNVIVTANDKTNSHRNYNRFHCDNRDDDIMTKLRKELNISPLEDEDENSGSMVPHVDFEPAGCANGLPDFEPPVARTENTCDSTLIPTYSNCVRTSNEIKYDFDMLDCSSEWVDAYNNRASHNTAESEAAVESILNDHHNPSELDLSGIEGLEDHLNDSQQSIPNGVRDEGEESGDSELQYISYPIPKSRVLMSESDGHSNDIQDQVQSAIKSILELQSDNRSYFDGDDSDIMPRLYELEKSHDSRKRCCVSPVSYVNLDGDIGVNSETDAALDEAVRSILQ